MRKFSIPFLAALVIVALFWGNCLSCPQLLLALGAHGCCHHAKIGCQSQGLSHFVKAADVHQAPGIAVVAQVEAAAIGLVTHGVEAPPPAVHAPPDLLALHSSFRI